MWFFSSLFWKKESVTSDIENIPWVTSIGNGRLEVDMDQFMDGTKTSFASMWGDMQWPPPPADDKRVPICPNCSHALDKIPERKKKCPHCGKQIYTYAKEVSPWKWERHLTGEEEWGSHYAAIEEEKRRLEEEHSSPEYINEELEKIKDLWCSRVIIQGSGCDHCMSKMWNSVSLATAPKMIWQKLSDQCDCPYFFAPDLDSRKL